MAILALYNNIEVEVTGTLKTGDGRTRATVRAMVGKPFTQFTHGGPVDTDTAIVSPDFLTNVHQVQADEPQPQPEAVGTYGKVRRSRMPGAKPEPVYVPFEAAELESMKALYPVRSRRQPWKGINSD